MVREDLIDGAVTFLQDPSVSAAPIEQKLSFLRSKNLTQEEIDLSLARVGQSPVSQSPPAGSTYPPYQSPPPHYGAYQQPSYWAQPPPESPRRDWRDWFIMATVASGVGYGMYWTAKRYIYPLIAPPTPPQIEQDKASIDASFDKAFALLEQLSTDTQVLKDAEKARTERLDSALGDIESIIGKLKEANESRALEAKRMAREMDEIKEQIPQAIQREKETTDNRLKDLATEMKSLKTLVSNRMTQPSLRPYASSSPYAIQPPNGINGTNTPNTAAPASHTDVNGAIGIDGVKGVAAAPEKAVSVLPERSSSGNPYGRILGGKAAIPDWQKGKKGSEDAKKDSVPQSLTESGTATEAELGA